MKLIIFSIITIQLVYFVQCVDKRKLSSGYEIPVIGLGTWQMNSELIEAAVTRALEVGYRHIDTAFVYDSEEAIGRSLKKWFDQGGKREDVFVTTKLPPMGNRPKDVEKYLNISLERLGLEYVDLFLIHKPYAYIEPKNEDADFELDEDGYIKLDFESNPVDAMEEQVKAGRVRSIGLSNFNETQILRIIENSEIKPSDVQVELYLYNQQKPLRKFCEKHNIAVTGYSSLGSGGTAAYKKRPGARTLPRPLHHSIVKGIAEDHKKTPAQVLLRHALQNNVIVIPKSTNSERIKSNFEVFDFTLSKEQMDRLNELDMGEEGRMFTFLDLKGLERHPEYPFTIHAKSSQ